MCIYFFCGRSSARLERLPVTQEAAGSNPVVRANQKKQAFLACFFYLFLL